MQAPRAKRRLVQQQGAVAMLLEALASERGRECNIARPIDTKYRTNSNVVYVPDSS